jgi:phenylalanyl-tRNA synthetase beta chain
MPKIELKKNDFYQLLGWQPDAAVLESLLESAKAELDDNTADCLKIELNDTNRPDLWSCAGIARQLNLYQQKKNYHYNFFKEKSSLQIIVDPSVQTIRPYIIGFGVKNITVDEPLLLELIQNQEKFAQNFGSKRHDIAIGIYKFNRIAFPIQYKAIDPSSCRFIPLAGEKAMNLAEILQTHPKGIEYAHLLKEKPAYPIIMDQQQQVLSFPPIINSKFIGEVEIGDNELFIEMTGFTLTNMLLIAAIMACDLTDRGAEIIPVQINYPYATEYGTSFAVPYCFMNSMKIELAELYKTSGFQPENEEITVCLAKMGYKNIEIKKSTISVDIPPYRNDIMHAADVIEDFIIGKGYNNFPIEMPQEFTIGSLTPLELFSDKLRTIAIGLGFNEVISNILTSKENIYQKMGYPVGTAVEIRNPMAESYNVLQNSIIPSLLEIETQSAKADYPHFLFEAGEVVIPDFAAENGSQTQLHLGFLSCHPKANFSEMRSLLDNVLYYAGINQFDIQADSNPFLIPGRSALVKHNGTFIGYFGELHPQILEKWDINMPATIMELQLDTILSLLQTNT